MAEAEEAPESPVAAVLPLEPVATPQPDPAREAFVAELKRFMDRFGAADGATYFVAGLTYEQALETQVEKLTADRKARERGPNGLRPIPQTRNDAKDRDHRR